jgi:hypothetical protein
MATLAVAVSLAFLSIPVLFYVPPVLRFTFGRSANLWLTLRVEQCAVRMSGSIDFTLTLKNVGTKEAELNYNTGYHMDLFLLSLDGKQIVHLPKGCRFTQVLTCIRLQPGESEVWGESWHTFDETGVTVPGLYLLQGSVLYFGTSKLPILIMP